jgi:sorting nexin-13
LVVIYQSRFINELIESFTLTSKEKSGQANQAQSTSGDGNVNDVRSRLPERILQRKPSLSGLEMIAISNLEGSIGEESKIIQPSPKKKGVHSASTGDLRAFTQLQISDAKSLKEVANISEHPGSECHGELGSVPHSDWAQVLDAVTQRRTQALTPEHLDNLWAKGRNYKKREIPKTTSLGVTVSQAADYPGKSSNLVLSESRVIAKSMAGTEGTSMTTNLAQLPVSLDRLHKNADSVDFLDIKQGYKSTERYKGLLFDNSEDRGQQFPGIGFSLHDTDDEHQRPLNFSEDLQVPIDSSSSQLATMESTQNQHGTACISQNSLIFSKNLERLDSDQQQYERPNILSSHRKSRSDDGGLEKWQELQGGSHQEEAVPTSLNSGRPTATTFLQHPDNAINRSHIEDESEMSLRPMTDVPTTVLTSHMSLNKLYCKARLYTDSTHFSIPVSSTDF